MALPPQPPGLNLCPILKDQPSSPNRLDLIVAVHHVRPCNPTITDVGQRRPEPLTIH
jgi:hypothetical protein